MELALVVASFLFVGLFGVSLGYHRYLAHKSFHMRHRWLEYVIVFLGLPAGTPVQWAGNHRVHHLFADTKKDPHSPYFGGFWHAHCGWYIGQKRFFPCVIYALAGPFRTLFDSFYRPRTNQQYNQWAKDIQQDPFFSWISQPLNYMVMVWLHAILLFSISFFFLGFTKGLLVAYLMYVLIYNLGDAVDSIGHLWGRPMEQAKHQARNSFLLGILTFGDGFHGTHHSDPRAARHGVGPSEFDLSYLCLKALSFIHVVTKIVPQKSVDDSSTL